MFSSRIGSLRMQTERHSFFENIDQIRKGVAMTMARIRGLAVATVVAIAFLSLAENSHAERVVVYQPPVAETNSQSELEQKSAQSVEELPLAPEFQESVNDVTCSLVSNPQRVKWGSPYTISWEVGGIGESMIWLKIGQTWMPVEAKGSSTFDFPVEAKASPKIYTDGIIYKVGYDVDGNDEPMECASLAVKSLHAPKPRQVTSRAANPDNNGSRYTAFTRLSGDPNRAIPEHIGGSKAAIARSIRECGFNNVFYDGACDALVEALRDREGLPITDRESLAAYIESDQVWTEPCTPEMLKSGHMYRYDRKLNRADADLVRTRCYEKEFTLVHNSEFYGKEHKFLLSGCLNASHYFGKSIPLVAVEVPETPEPKPLMNLGFIPPCECEEDDRQTERRK
jgi:hypothetical protein